MAYCRTRGAACAAIAGAALAAACAGQQPRVRVLPPRAEPAAEAPAPGRPSPALPPADGGGAAFAGEAIARTAERLLGAPYRDGGAQPDGFDCSGLVSYVFARHGIPVPRDVRRQAVAGIEVEPAEVLPGDLLFFATTGSGPTHVGIAMGGGRFIHAPKNGAVVRMESLSSTYWSSRFVSARRLLGSGPVKRGQVET
ncbi:MAG TPA: C40 family peptidase [Vicinamibacterales bacterium]|nr:C40 family peptidase [Vicinamibacterales bacterium]HPW19829.1 C40 family peptidase [Vicinamibacterales bacterium]